MSNNDYLTSQRENGVYYQVGESFTSSKIHALQLATSQNITPRWNFFNQEFDSVPWDIAPSDLNLTELYRRRARELRDKYNYLILWYSGGSDSWTALRAFIDQGIYPDEILVSIPKDFIDKDLSSINSRDISSENSLAEWNLQIEPNLIWLGNHYPQIKITISDWSTRLTSDMSVDAWHGGAGMYNFQTMAKFNSISSISADHSKLSENHSVGIITGQDKPQVTVRDNKFYLYFIDVLAGITPQTAGQTLERFYWSPDCIDILRAQAWLMYEYFLTHPKMLGTIEIPRKHFERKIEYDDIARHIVYSQWSDTNSKSPFFYVRKNAYSLNSETSYVYLEKYKSDRLITSWKSQTIDYASSIDKKYHTYVNGKLDGFTGFISKFYLIGNMKNENNV